MIKKLIGAAICVLIGAVMMFASLANHFVRAKDGTHAVPKATMTLTDSFVDIRAWTAKDFAEHQAVTKALIDNGKKDLVVEQSGNAVQDAVKGATDAVKGAVKDWLGGDKPAEKK